MTTHHIGEPATLPVNQLNCFHKNPRRGDVDAIKGSLAANGQYRPIVVNKGTHTGRLYEVLAGNHTLMACRELAEDDPDGWGEIACFIVDVDDDRASRIVLADNRTADLGGYDNDELLELLDGLEGDTLTEQLAGTAYSEDYLNALLGGNAPEELPEPGDAEVTDPLINYGIVVECDNEREQMELLERFMEEGLECRAIM